MNFTILVGEECNLRCDYCYEKNKINSNMSNNTMKNTINFIKNKLYDENNTNIIHRVILIGGEALLYFDKVKYFVEELKKIKQYKIVFELTTNGTIYSKEISLFLKKHFSSISISIDGDEENHNKKRIFKNGKGSHRIVIENRNKFKNDGLVVRDRMTLSKENISNFYNDLKFISKSNSSMLVIVFDFYSEWDNEDLNILKKEVDKVLKDEEIDKTNISMFDFWNYNYKKIDCLGGITSFTISSLGDIYPCIISVGNDKFKIGNVLDGKIDNDKLIKIIPQNKNCEGCESCLRKEYCSGNRCKIINYILTGSYYKKRTSECINEHIMRYIYRGCDFN